MRIGNGMKRLTIVMLALFLTGCGLKGLEEDLYRKDTVIYIPAEPTTAPTEQLTEATQPEPTETLAKPELYFFPSVADRFSTESKETSSGSGKKPSTKETEPTVIVTEPSATNPPQTADQVYEISDYVAGFLEESIMDRVNSLRREAGLTELQKSDRLSAIASVRAYEGSRSWSHTRPDGRDYTTVFQDYGFSAGTVGENLLYSDGGEDGATLVSKWMAAETNRENLMYEGFTTIGVGIYEANGYEYIACLLAG